MQDQINMQYFKQQEPQSSAQKHGLLRTTLPKLTPDNSRQVTNPADNQTDV